MIDILDIKSVIDTKFWKHITKDVLISEGVLDRDKLIEGIVAKVNSGRYISSDPREIIVYSKSRNYPNRIARLVPQFSTEDYVLLYYLLRKIEEELSLGMHKNAFGAFRNFQYRRDLEQRNHEMLIEDLLPSPGGASSFLRYYWVFEWKEFQGKTRLFLESNKNNKYFISFDIADFYNSISLTHLEMLLRGSVSGEKQYFINLLMHFLRSWNKISKKYFPESKGIPQDEVGDMSRLLANFFLKNFDYQINEFASKRNSQVLRYADDHIIFASSQKIAAEILFYASIQLQAIGLCINSSKVYDFKSRKEFKNYWAFKIHEHLDQKRVGAAASLFLKQNRESIRWDSCLLRFINFKPNKIRLLAYNKICDYYMEDGILASLKSEQMIKLYNFMPTTKRGYLLKRLYELTKLMNFNSFHFQLLNAIEKNKDFQLFFTKRKLTFIRNRISIIKNNFFHY